MRLPRMLSFAEDAVKQAVKASVSRGKVDVFITVHSEGAADVKVSLNAPMVEGYLAAMKQMVADYGVQDDISVSLLSRMNDVFTVEKPEVDEEQLLADAVQFQPTLYRLITNLATREEFTQMQTDQKMQIYQVLGRHTKDVENQLQQDGKAREKFSADLSRKLSEGLRDLDNAKENLK